MIVISGALVLVALVLLVVGLTVEDLPFVYGSIGTSLLAFVFLVVGILQRRGEQAEAPTAEPAPATLPALSLEKRQPVPVPVVAAPVDATEPAAPVQAPVQVAPQPQAEGEAEGEAEGRDEEIFESAGLVLVVAGRPRYHVDGCRYLNGKDVEEIDVLDARDEGFTPCGVCRPDKVIAAELEADRLEDQDLHDGPAAEAGGPAPPARDDGTLFDDPSLLDDQPNGEPDPEPVPAPAAAARRGSRPLQVAGDRTVVPAAPAPPAPSTSPASAAAEAVAVGVVALAAAGVAASAGIKASRAAKAPAKPAKAPAKPAKATAKPAKAPAKAAKGPAKAAKAPAGSPPATAAEVAPAAPPAPDVAAEPAAPAAPSAPALPSPMVLPDPPVPAESPVPRVAPVSPAAPVPPAVPVAPATGRRSSAARGAPGGAKAPTVRTPTVAGPVRSSAATSAAAPATAAKRGTVVVIPDRGRFHRAECRYVRDAAGAVELSRASATKQSYEACGVCKP